MVCNAGYTNDEIKGSTLAFSSINTATQQHALGYKKCLKDALRALCAPHAGGRPPMMHSMP